jgi:hypothetical protein
MLFNKEVKKDSLVLEKSGQFDTISLMRLVSSRENAEWALVQGFRIKSFGYLAIDGKFYRFEEPKNKGIVLTAIYNYEEITEEQFRLSIKGIRTKSFNYHVIRKDGKDMFVG